MSETLVTVQLRFETDDRESVFDRIGALVQVAAEVPSSHTSISVQDFEDGPE